MFYFFSGKTYRRRRQYMLPNHVLRNKGTMKSWSRHQCGRRGGFISHGRGTNVAGVEVAPTYSFNDSGLSRHQCGRRGILHATRHKSI